MNNYHRAIEFCRHFMSHQDGDSNKTLVWATVAAAIAAGASAYAAFQQKAVSHNSFVHSLHTQFFDIMQVGMEKKLKNIDEVLRMYANFYEYVSWNILNKRVKLDDIQLLTTDMVNKRIVSYVKSKNKLNKDHYDYYIRWLKENK